MGLYDEIRVEYRLPDGWDPGTHVFQTKDTPDQDLERYVLRADGALIHEETGERLEYHGPLTFYTSNWCGSGPWGDMTTDDQPLWTAEYLAYFHYGTLLRLQGSKRREDTRRPLISRAQWYAHHQAWDMAKQAQRKQEEEEG